MIRELSAVKDQDPENIRMIIVGNKADSEHQEISSQGK